jgi:hypothetical protein
MRAIDLALARIRGAEEKRAALWVTLGKAALLRLEL